jgi:hypothetical protein
MPFSTKSTDMPVITQDCKPEPTKVQDIRLRAFGELFSFE